MRKPWKWWKASREWDGKGEVVCAVKSWVKAEFLLGFCLVTDVVGSSSGIKKKSQKPPQERGVGRTVSATGTKAMFAHFERAAVDVHDKRCKKDLWFEPQFDSSQSVWGWITFLFDIRGLLSDTKSCWWLLSQGRGEPGALSSPRQVRASPAPLNPVTAGSQLSESSAEG